MWVLGLAVPVTASYIIAAVMVVPALVQVGVAELAAHMFVFYYAVLSEVSPPTALSPFAAAAITGGNPFRTTMLSWKYTAPAFVVPFAFTIDPRGLGLLLHSTPGTYWATRVSSLASLLCRAPRNGWMRERLVTSRARAGGPRRCSSSRAWPSAMAGACPARRSPRPGALGRALRG